MSTPVPAPTADEIEIVAEIVMEDVDAVTSFISQYTQTIANAKWARTLTDITTWADIVDEAGDIKKVGSIEFFEHTIGISRLAFRNKVRLRYGLDMLMSETVDTAFAVSSTNWF